MLCISGFYVRIQLDFPGIWPPRCFAMSFFFYAIVLTTWKPCVFFSSSWWQHWSLDHYCTFNKVTIMRAHITTIVANKHASLLNNCKSRVGLNLWSFLSGSKPSTDVINTYGGNTHLTTMTRLTLHMLLHDAWWRNYPRVARVNFTPDDGKFGLDQRYSICPNSHWHYW